ncbi:MAG: cell division protein ZapA [Tenacibaculum sp.]
MAKLKVNVIIASRTYPLSVDSTDQEGAMRKAANNINKLIAKFEQNYAVADKQDVLAMCALQFASKLEIFSANKTIKDNKTLKKIQALTSLLEAKL